MIAIAFCERESDLAPMTIWKRADGRLEAHRRRDDDVIDRSGHACRYDDAWMHLKTRGAYLRLDVVDDVDQEPPVSSYHYSAIDGGREWLRARESWHEVTDGTPRFERLPENPGREGETI